MNDQQLAAERAAFEKCIENSDLAPHLPKERWLDYYHKRWWGFKNGWQAALAQREPVMEWPILKGVGKINGDGWKDTTRMGDVVYVWNEEHPKPYAPGQYPRIGNTCGWTASTSHFNFQPAAIAEIKDLFERTEAARLAAEKQATVMRHGFGPLQQFHTKYALGPMLPPSCLVCGCQTVPSKLEMADSVAIKHAELPGIVVCKSCAEARAQLAIIQAGFAEQTTQIDVLQTQLTAERARSEKLVEALKSLFPWVVTQEVACHGLKCREAVCSSCSFDYEAAVEQAQKAWGQAHEVLTSYQSSKENGECA